MRVVSAIQNALKAFEAFFNSASRGSSGRSLKPYQNFDYKCGMRKFWEHTAKGFLQESNKIFSKR